MLQSLIVCIPAHNEASVIAQTVAAIKPHLFAGDRLVVFDDGSIDETAVLAEQGGAYVLRRPLTETQGEKGGALRWGLTELGVAEAEVVIVLDADTQIDPSFLQSIRNRFDGDAQVVQGFILPSSDEFSPVATLAACSTLMEQQADDRLRAWLHWPIRLRGTGMAFRGALLVDLLSSIRTQVEDVELSLLLADRGVNVVFAPEAVIYDPLPISSDTASRQRARWLTGQLQIWAHYWPLVLRLLLRGPGVWSLIGCLLVKPRALFAAFRLALFLISMVVPQFWLLSLGLGLMILADALYFSAAILLFGGPRRWQISLRSIFGYGAMWMQSAFTAVRKPRPWLRARP